MLWNNDDANNLLTSVTIFNAKQNESNTDPVALISTTHCMIAMAGNIVAKVPPKELCFEDKIAFLKVEYEFGRRLPGRHLVKFIGSVCLKSKILLREASESKEPVLIMDRLPKDSELMLMAQGKSLPQDAGVQLGKMLMILHDTAPIVPLKEALKTWDFEKRDVDRYLDRLAILAARSNPNIAKYMYSLRNKMLLRIKSVFKILQKRAERGFYRDIHADPHMENVFFVRGAPSLIDPMPKKIRRRVDVLTDAARVGLELLRLGEQGHYLSFLQAYPLTHEEQEVFHFFMGRHMIADWWHFSPIDGIRYSRRFSFIFAVLDPFIFMPKTVINDN